MADQEWQFGEFADQASAVSFLNADPKQGAGEASATLRNDGTVGLIYLEPGSLGTDPSPSWYVLDEPSASDTVSFLNADPRQGPGEASTTPRSDGTVGLLYLEPGSLGTIASPSWYVAEFANPQDAVDFLNASPQQTAGEAAGFIRSDNSTVVFFLEP
jgi:hypothetical protein